MLRGNLSTRPFYNERLVTMALLLVGAGALALTAYNATRLIELSAQRKALNAKITSEQESTNRIQAQAAAIQKTVDNKVLTGLANSTREANDLIDQRTFSWTVFFDLVEKTMPFDVRLVGVSPRVEKGTFRVNMLIVARRTANVDDFIDALNGTGRFYDVVPTDQTMKDDGTYTANVEAAYLPPNAIEKAPARATKGKGTP